MADDSQEPVKSPLSLLADKMYGASEEPPADPPADPPASPPDDSPENPDGAPDPDPSNPPSDPPGEEEVELSSLEELAEHFELDPEWLRKLKVTEKVNGQPVEVSLEDALATHRKVAAADAYLADAKQKAKGIVEQATQQQTEFAANIATFGKLLEQVEQEIDRDVKAIDWTKLREDDPAEYSAKKEEVRERRERLESLKAEAKQSLQEAAEQGLAKQQQALAERLPQELETLLERVPEWKDEAKASTERKEVMKYLTDEGFSEQDIQAASFNGRILAMVIKAMRYDASKQKSQAIKKKVVKIPKVMKPGSKPNGAGKPTDAPKRDLADRLYS